MIFSAKTNNAFMPIPNIFHLVKNNVRIKRSLPKDQKIDET